MKTIDIEIAVMAYLGIRKNLIVPNVSWGLVTYEMDLLSLTQSRYATEIEIKILTGKNAFQEFDVHVSLVIIVTPYSFFW